ncbi:MAG: preprotein translocase subunit SecE [Deinococcus sp.]|nr:preprotein translocase subunit SecE [Deinococcus sp.]
MRFFRDSWAELRRVTWTSMSEIRASTWIVITMVLAFTLAVGVIDNILLFLFRLVLG